MKEMINYKRKTLVKCPRRAGLQLLLHLIVDILDYTFSAANVAGVTEVSVTPHNNVVTIIFYLPL